jgi:tRNA (guanine37-N1)-methyltransferase
MVLVDAVVRLLPGALGSPLSAVDESHSAGLLEYPQYTRPAEFRGWRVPDVLLSGHHAEIARWRREQALRRTRERRPDLLPHPTDAPHSTDAPHPRDDPGAAAILAPESTEQTSHA